MAGSLLGNRDGKSAAPPKLFFDRLSSSFGSNISTQCALFVSVYMTSKTHSSDFKIEAV